MPITLNSVYESIRDTYQLKLMAGKNGLVDVVSWTHIMEDMHNADFLRGSELVITTGMCTSPEESEEWLLSFLKSLDDNHACGLIINLGKHIMTLPDSAIIYCNSIDFPLFTMPWKMHHVDIVRDCCNKIFAGEQLEESVTKAFQKAIFSPERRDAYIPFLTARGYHADDYYCVATIQEERAAFTDDEIAQRFQIILSNQLSRQRCRFHLFQHEDTFVAIVHGGGKDVCAVTDTVRQLNAAKFPGEQIRTGVGPTLQGLGELGKSYRRSLSALRYARLCGSDATQFDTLGIYQILLACDDPGLLADEVERTLGKLIAYDKAHNTNNMEILELYIKSNFSVQEVSAKTFMHRNTVNYRIRKIKEVLGNEMEAMEDKLRFLLAFYILTIL